MKDREANSAFDVKVLASRGQAVYDRDLRPALEAPNYGRYLAIEPDTGQYWVGDTVEAVSRYPASAADVYSSPA